MENKTHNYIIIGAVSELTAGVLGNGSELPARRMFFTLEKSSMKEVQEVGKISNLTLGFQPNGQMEWNNKPNLIWQK